MENLQVKEGRIDLKEVTLLHEFKPGRYRIARNGEILRCPFRKPIVLTTTERSGLFGKKETQTTSDIPCGNWCPKFKLHSKHRENGTEVRVSTHCGTPNTIEIHSVSLLQEAGKPQPEAQTNLKKVE